MSVILLVVLLLPIHSSAEAVDKDKAVELASKLYNDLHLISESFAKYRSEYGEAPKSLADMSREDVLKKLPTMGPELGDGLYEIVLKYDDMDGKGEMDSAIFTTVDVPLEVCVEYNKSFAQEPLNEGPVFDFKESGSKYPGELYGLHMKTFAIKWPVTVGCQINWVLDYN